MAKTSAIFLFTRNGSSLPGFFSENEAASDADGVVRSWEMIEGRAADTILDQHEVFIARLTYDEELEREALEDLADRCVKRGLLRERINEMQLADKLRAE